MESKRCGTCTEYNKRKRECRLRKKFVMKISPPCINWKEKNKQNEQ